MKLNPDDPRVTAYALGELPADEARLLETDLAESPETRTAIEETRAIAALLTKGLAAEAARPADPGLAGAVEQHLASGSAPEAADAAAAEPENVVPLPTPRTSWGVWIAAAAACIVLASFLLPGLGKPKLRALRLAAVDPAQETPPPAPAPAAPGPAAVAAPAPSSTSASASAPVAEPAPAEMRRYADAPPPGAGGFAAPTSKATAPVSASVPANRAARDSAAPTTFTMSPELMRRYGLGPASGAAPTATPVTPTAPSTRVSAPAPKSAAPANATPTSGRSPSPAAPGSMDPALRARYGMSGGAAGPTRTLALAQEAVRSEAESRFQPPPPSGPMPRPYPIPEDAYRAAPNNPGYVDVGENPFRPALDEPLSTFSLDVDTGSYANLRRFLNAGQRPPRDAVRLEEMINYFRYQVTPPRGDEAFGVTAEVASCPWAPRNRLVRLAIQARELEGPRPAGNLVFLVDVSGSMTPPERLPLLKQALKALVRRLSPDDRVAIVTYASSAGVHLPSTSGEQKEVLLEAIDRLEPGGSTNGEGGLRSAYDVALAHFIRGGVNRVLLCTDGDFNVGVSNQDDLVRLIEEKARTGVFLTTLGVGTDNFKDALMRRLADRGNGSYHYLDSFEEAQRVLVGEMNATFVTVARDAKAQVEFNPARVGAWRLLGYEKRILAHQDFNDDTKDAGDIGAGHLVTVLYEIIPPGTPFPAGVDPLKYQRPPEPVRPARDVVASDDLLTLKLRYQRPEGSRSTLLERAVRDDDRAWSRATPDFKFAAAVASFGMLLRESPHRGNATYESVLELGREGRGADPDGWRAEFLALVQKARSLAPRGR